jgi:hypothetical protein
MVHITKALAGADLLSTFFESLPHDMLVLMAFILELLILMPVRVLLANQIKQLAIANASKQW